MQVLEESTWRARAATHADRLDPYLRPHLTRRKDRVKHPVHDFLFTYYSQRPARLHRWHPGFGIELRDGEQEYGALKGYLIDERAPSTDAPRRPGSGSVTVSPEYVASQRPLLESLRALLTATAGRPANFGCFGLHEWAMVYRLADDQTRHMAWPLRLGGGGTDQVVEAHRIACSHFDAYRFFTDPARPLNVLRPGSDDRTAYEQPGCLHGSMDLYKHAFRLTPMICSDLVADAFELAWDIRIMDMRAAPYDLTGLLLDPTGEPWTPVPIETPDGKAEYAAAQRAFSERAAPIRAALIEECERLIRSVGPV